MNPAFPYRLYLVIGTSGCGGRDWLHVAAEALSGGVELLQFRDKGLPDKAFREAALRLRDLTHRAGVPLIINDRVGIAQDIAADGVHVGTSDRPPVAIRDTWPDIPLLGYSIEALEQLDSPQTAAAGHLGISPVFRTATKTDTVIEWGVAGLAEIRARTAKPLVAIGNINETNAEAVLHAGADCLAVVAAICAEPDPRRAAARLRNLIERTS
jgi:thiamine-phosphate pyrophosphorylase